MNYVKRNDKIGIFVNLHTSNLAKYMIFVDSIALYSDLWYNSFDIVCLCEECRYYYGYGDFISYFDCFKWGKFCYLI